MTFVSVTQATRRLGIDAKTLRRWLAEVQIPLQCHPHDGRTKGVSQEHLPVLARLHQRSLAPLPEESPAATAGEGLELPAARLPLPEQLGALQAQTVALQQQMADLTRLLQQQAHSPVPRDAQRVFFISSPKGLPGSYEHDSRSFCPSMLY